MAEALYRKYRPQVFEDMVGQDHIERTLKNAIDQGKVSHAYLFCGPRGTGKTTTARLLAKALLCENGPTSSPDGSCQNCLDVAEGQHPDVYELDAASRTGVENVREEIIGRVNFAPTRGSKKIYIIDEVHMLSSAAFNALLKTLEEPPSHVVFVLCTTDPQKVPATIHSRCQRFDFHRLSTEEIVSRLGAVCMAEEASFEGDALTIIAHRADGGMRNALTTLEQLIAFGDGEVTVRGAEDLLGSLGSSDMAQILDAVGRRDVAACFNWVANYCESGADLAQFAKDMAERVRNIYVMSLAGSEVTMDLAETERRQLAEELKLFGPDRASRMLGVLGDLVMQLKTAGNPRLCFEIALTRMVRPDCDLTLESLAERIEALEAGKSAVATVVAVPAAAPVQPVAAPAPVSAAAPDAFAHAASQAPAQPPVASPAPTKPVAAPVQPAAPQAAPVPVSQAVPAPASHTAPAPAAPAEAARAPMPVQAAPAPASPASGAPSPAAAVSAAAAVPAAGADSGLASIISNPAALQRVWRSVVAAVKKAKMSYGVLFVNVKVRPEADGSGLLVEFPEGNAFAYSLACKPEVNDLIARSFEQVAGMPVPFRCVQAQGPAQPVTPSAPAPMSAPAAPQAAPAPASHAAPAPTASAHAAPAPAVPIPAPPACAVPASQPCASPDFDDRVPLDAYDDMVPYDDSDGSAYDGFAGTPGAAPASPSPMTPPVQDAARPQEQAPWDFAEDASSDIDLVTKMVSSSFGTDINFTEEN